MSCNTSKVKLADAPTNWTGLTDTKWAGQIALGHPAFSAYVGTWAVMLRKLYGSVAKLVNDLLPERIKPFWGDERGKDYFDGCLRDVLRMRRTFRYVYTQCRRHHICSDPREYRHTRVNVELESAVRRAIELNAFLYGVPYRRYERY